MTMIIGNSRTQTILKTPVSTESTSDLVITVNPVVTRLVWEFPSAIVHLGPVFSAPG